MSTGPAAKTVLLCGSFDADEKALWLKALRAELPGVRWVDEARAREEPAAIEVAVVANPPPGSLQNLPRLRLVQSLWAGVDRLLQDTTLPAGVPIARMVDPAMTAAMAQTAVWTVLSLHRGFFNYAAQQRQGLWRSLPQWRADEVPVLVLGQGEMGRATQAALRALGYPVQAWHRGAGPLEHLLPQARVLINLLPLTPQTRGLLGAEVFNALPAQAGVVNLARGAHVVDEDLLQALASGQVGHAVLDVFNVEPLPAHHRYWNHPQVTVLPHAAAATDERSAARVVAHNLRAFWAGQSVLHLVDRLRGY